MRQVLGIVVAAVLVLAACVACSTGQGGPCKSTDRAIATETAAEHIAKIDADYPGQIVSYCERGDSGTVEVFTTLGFSWSDSAAMTMCRRIFNSATNSTIKAPGLKRVLIRLSDGSKAADCGPA